MSNHTHVKQWGQYWHCGICGVSLSTDTNQPDHIVDMHEMVTDTYQATGDTQKAPTRTLSEQHARPYRHARIKNMPLEKALDAIPGLRSIAEFVFYATILAITIPGIALAAMIATTFITVKTFEFLVFHPEFVTWIY